MIAKDKPYLWMSFYFGNWNYYCIRNEKKSLELINGGISCDALNSIFIKVRERDSRKDSAIVSTPLQEYFIFSLH